MTVAALRRFAHDRKGNVAIIFAFALMPIVFLTGMGIDYTVATQKKTMLDAAADAAALSGVTPAMMAQPSSASVTAAQNMFNSQVANIPGLDYAAPNLSVTATDNGASSTSDTCRKVPPPSGSPFHHSPDKLKLPLSLMAGSANGKICKPYSPVCVLLLNAAATVAPGASTGKPK